MDMRHWKLLKPPAWVGHSVPTNSTVSIAVNSSHVSTTSMGKELGSVAASVALYQLLALAATAAPRSIAYNNCGPKTIELYTPVCGRRDPPPMAWQLPNGKSDTCDAVLPVRLPDVPDSTAVTATSPALLPQLRALLVGVGVTGGVPGALPDPVGVPLRVKLGVGVTLGVAVVERLTPIVLVADAERVRGAAEVGRGDTLMDGCAYDHVSVYGPTPPACPVTSTYTWRVMTLGRSSPLCRPQKLLLLRVQFHALAGSEGHCVDTKMSVSSAPSTHTSTWSVPLSHTSAPRSIIHACLLPRCTVCAGRLSVGVSEAHSSPVKASPKGHGSLSVLREMLPRAPSSTPVSCAFAGQ